MCTELLAEYPSDTDEYALWTSENDPGEPADSNQSTEAQPAKSILAHTRETNSTAVGNAEEVAKDFQLKGLIQNASRPSLLVRTGIKTYTLVQGETLLVKTRKGQVLICFEKLTGKQVVLKIDGKSVVFSL